MIKRDIIIGKITGTHGNKGMLKVIPITDFPDRFLEMKTVTLEVKGKYQTFTVAEAAPHRRHILIKLDEIPDMIAAEALKGALVKIAREELAELPEGSYYIFDIVGLKVYNPGGVLVGEIEDVIQTGANDVYVIKTGGGPLLVPALKEVVREIDIRGGKMVVDYSEANDISG